MLFLRHFVSPPTPVGSLRWNFFFFDSLFLSFCLHRDTFAWEKQAFTSSVL